MAAAESPSVGTPAPFTPEEARLIGHATNLEMVGLLVSVLAGFGVAKALDFSVPGIALGVAAAIGCDTIGRVIYWRVTRPLAHLATGNAPRYDRVYQAARLHIDTMALIGAPLLGLAKLDIPTWQIAAGMIAAVLGSFAIEVPVRRYLRRCNDRDARNTAERSTLQ